MKFFDKNKVVGRLEIIKIDSRTGEEEVIFDEHNVITEGMGMNLTQLMTRGDCAIDPCGQEFNFKVTLNPTLGIDYAIGTQWSE